MRVDVRMGTHRLGGTFRPRRVAPGGARRGAGFLLGKAERPGGLGNDYDLVGRFFVEHPAIRSGVFEQVTPSILARKDLLEVSTDGNGRFRATIALAEDVVREEGLLNTRR